ncbi:MAG: ABC transporter permease [Opitutales bacterium]|nr:ABC transporter permease [Opitutales bacterium]
MSDPPRNGPGSAGRIRFADTLRLAAASLGGNRLRSFLTILGIAIGVFSVVGVMTALSAVRQSIDSGLAVLGANTFQVMRDNPDIQMGGVRSRWRGRPNITPRQGFALEAALAAEGFAVTANESQGGQRARFGDRRTSPRIRIVGTNEHYAAANNYEISYGRNLSSTDIEFNRPVVVIGREIEESLFPSLDPLGERILLGNAAYEVVGVLTERGTRFGSSLDNIALIPSTRFVANHWHRWRTMNITVQAPDMLTMRSAIELAVTEMRIIRGLAPEDPNNFDIFTNDALQDAFAEIAYIVGIGGLLISAIALVCAGIGIMNIMLVSVTERTREIGVRKSIGARRRDILTQFLLEAVFLSEFGAVIGILLGFAAGNAVAATIGVPMIIPWFWIGVAVIVCSFIGIAFGFFPALRAARLDPVEALRYE